MEDGIIKNILIGIALAIVAVVIIIAFSIFSTAKNTANDGVVGVQDALGAMSDSIYNDFDQKTIAGTQVLSAYNQMNGKPIAIIVKTCKGNWVNYNALVAPFTTTTTSQTASPFQSLAKDAASKQYQSSVSYFDKTSSGVEINLVLSADADVSKRTVMYNNVVTDMTKSGNSNFITSTAKFNAYLIKDPGDTVIGIVFIQQGKHTVGT